MVGPVHHRSRVRPIRGRNSRLVLPRRGLVKDRQKFVCFARRRLQVDDGVGAVAVVRVEDQVSVEVSRVKSRQRKAVAVSGQRGLRWGHGRSGRGREQVVEQAIGFVPGNTTALK
jgi:hypothetical protein